MNTIVCSYETSKAPKKAGWKKSTEFVFIYNGGENDYLLTHQSIHYKKEVEDLFAPTLQELLEELPMESRAKIVRYGNEWCCDLEAETGEMNEPFFHESPVEAAAQLYIKLFGKES